MTRAPEHDHQTQAALGAALTGDHSIPYSSADGVTHWSDREGAEKFCYIAERADGEMLLALRPLDPGMPALWTRDPDQAVRHTLDGIRALQKRWGAAIGFRKILVG